MTREWQVETGVMLRDLELAKGERDLLKKEKEAKIV